MSTACITATGYFIDISDLPENLPHRSARLANDQDWRPLSFGEVRRHHIQKVFQMYGYLKRRGYDVRPHSHTSGAAA